MSEQRRSLLAQFGKSQPKTDTFKWMSGWHALFFTLLTLLVGLALSQPEFVDQRIRIGMFSAILYIWYIGSAILLREPNTENSPYMLAYFVVGWLAWFSLTEITELFMLLLFVLFPHVFSRLKFIWASIGAVILMTLAFLRSVAVTNQSVDDLLLFMSIATISGIVFGYFINAIINESERRRDLILKLEQTRRELAQAEREAGILQERQRLAGEIHDTLAQGLTSVVTHLEAAENALTNDPLMHHYHLTEAKNTARAGLNEARRFVWALQPKILETQTFEAAIQSLVEQWSASHTITANVYITGAVLPLQPEQEVALLRVVQEALTNIAKHASAHAVNVTVSYLPDLVIVDIQDDGVGFQPEDQPSGHGDHGYGLIGMRERITRLHGTLTIESTPGEGTSGEGTIIVAEIPLREVKS